MRYPVVIELGTDTTAFGVIVPDLPGCFSAGDTLDEAMPEPRTLRPPGSMPPWTPAAPFPGHQAWKPCAAGRNTPVGPSASLRWIRPCS